MFTADGKWKEFGIGRDPERYTWIPFWLFAILSAILSYIVVLLFAGTGSLPGVSVVEETVTSNVKIIENSQAATTVPTKRRGSVSEMKPGYYILNMEETAKKGVPKYIFLGPEPPNLIYNHAEE